MTYVYYLSIEGNNLEIIRKTTKFIVNLNGNFYNTFKKSYTSILFSIREDYPIEIDGSNYIVAIRGEDVRLVENGRYLDNNQEFKPTTSIPRWIVIFLILNILLPFIWLGGEFHFLIAFGGFYICTRVCQSTRFSSRDKFLLCIATTVGAWLIWLLMR